VIEPNTELRRRRESTRSHTAPSSGLSRQELAEQVNKWLFEKTGKIYEIDANYIGKLERGVIHWPQKAYRAALRAVLGADTDQELGFYIRRSGRPTVEAMDRQQFLRMAAAAGAGVLIPFDLLTPSTQTPLPKKVGEHEIAQLRLAAATFDRWDHRFGGTAARDVATAQLNRAARLLKADCPTALRNDLFAAVSLLGGVAGFAAFDAYAHEDARRLFRFALACAEESDDWHLRASILSKMARQNIWCGEPDQGLTQVELALVRADRLSATERASLHTLRARALAKLGRMQETLSAVGAADEAFAHSRPASDPPWISFYDHAQHHGDTAHALFDLSLRGRRTEAASRLAYAVAHHGQAFSRSRAFSQIKLASLVMATGDPRRAASIGQRALQDAKLLRSRRAINDLKELRRFSDRHPKIVEAVELRDRINEVVDALG
jgi:tetratricopeptide (TPR) repeat protein